MDVAAAFLADARGRFAQYRRLAEGALAQADDAAFFAALHPPAGGVDGEANPLALQVKHLAGNFRSRWTDFLTADLDKPDRHRDREFVVEPGDTREALMARWAEGWAACEATLDALTPADLLRTVTLRREPMTALSALTRGLAHTAYHVGQIVLLAKHHAGPAWRTLSIPRGASETFTATLHATHGR
jgi:hypothetical protein